jgi:hypothetical protein
LIRTDWAELIEIDDTGLWSLEIDAYRIFGDGKAVVGLPDGDVDNQSEATSEYRVVRFLNAKVEDTRSRSCAIRHPKVQVG